MRLETYRGLLYEIRDLSRGAAVYASDLSSDKVDGPFNFAMYNIIAKNANTILDLFRIIESCPNGVEAAIEQKIKHEYRTEKA